MALLSFRGISTPSLPAQGEQRRFSYFNIQRDIPPQRSLSVSAHEDVRQHVAGLAATDAFKQSARERRKVEMLFAHLKRNLNFRRLRLRGMTGARDECTLAAVAQNLRKLVRLIGFSPPPLAAACA